jgi:Xaa-Pro aminopeptidase
MTIDVVPDDQELRWQRRERVLEQMEADGIDVLVLGREANARYIAGTRRYWIAGSRPFGAGCVIVRQTGQVYLLSTWDEGVPDDIPHENLHGISFNPVNTIDWLQSIDGARTARRVGVDGFTPFSSNLLSAAMPAAEVVDGEQAMRAVRVIKTDVEIAVIRRAVAVAEAGLTATVDGLTAGVTERELTAVFMNAIASRGVTTPSTQNVAWITSRDNPWRRSGSSEPTRPGDLVAFDASVVVDGYLGEVGRTSPVAGSNLNRQDQLRRRWKGLWKGLFAACQPGNTGADLLNAYSATNAAHPPMPVARGMGLGYDLPVISGALPETAAKEYLKPGMVLALTGYLWEGGVGGVYHQEAVHITPSGPALLSSSPGWEDD